MKGALWSSCFILLLLAVPSCAFHSPHDRIASTSSRYNLHCQPFTKLHSATSDATTDTVADAETEDSTANKEALGNLEMTLQKRLVRLSPNNWVENDLSEFVNLGILSLICLAVLAKVSLVNQDITRGWTAAEISVRVPLDNWNDYIKVLSESPIETKAVTSATVYTIGDIIAQQTEGTKIGELDRLRTLRSLLAGFIGHGPMSHIWYNFSENIFESYLHWTAWWSFFPKVVLDQAMWSPLWNNTYIILLGLMKRESVETMWDDVKRTTIPLIVSGLKLWPLAHCVTYGLIPVENRLLWVDVVEIFWVTILATQAAGATKGDGEPSSGH
mmetsp:Transcript_5188/g.7507  ORF Transcript_5188/g.7507 Transcript_5188/m.7507 type:complete len:329 (+) Transcript_5188:148-1134(+)